MSIMYNPLANTVQIVDKPPITGQAKNCPHSSTAQSASYQEVYTAAKLMIAKIKRVFSTERTNVLLLTGVI
jgi:hypothetical protein